MSKFIDIMQERRSVRTYTGETVSQSDLDKAADILLDTSNPFGAEVRFCVVDNEHSREKLGTYGFIRGAKTFVLGCLKPSGKDIEGFGYAFEKAILKLTSIGLATCWMGGTLRRGVFERAANLKGEILPAASPIGYANVHRSVIERIVAAGAGARKRKRFSKLFFETDFAASLEKDETALCTCLQMVRIGPSASNKQPWRAVKVGDDVHFYLAKTQGYSGNKAFGFCMQRIDMGIAACHFELAARELGLNGKITIADPQISGRYEYSFTWEGQKQR